MAYCTQACQLGAGAYTDYGTLTILHADDAPSCTRTRPPKVQDRGRTVAKEFGRSAGL